ncbi:MAG: ATP-binding protein [Verrucomicrobia bacterium]|nr:ATP-binding protein [Verrucomicrobiota bacterium]
MKKLEFASHPANLGLVRNCVRQFLQDRGFPNRQVDLMVLGIDEACTNIIRHAYHLAEDKLITLALESHPKGVRFRLRDYGEQAEAAKVQGRPLDHVRPGGLGLHLIHHAFDQVDYQRRRQGTMLVLTKFAPENLLMSSQVTKQRRRRTGERAGPESQSSSHRNSTEPKR